MTTFTKRLFLGLFILCILGCQYSPETQLLRSVVDDDIQSVKALLDQRVDVNYQTQRMKQSALESASGIGREAIARLLLAKGADPNLRNRKGSTALHEAAYSGYPNIVQMLIDAGADLNVAESEYGYTPIATAAFKGHPDVVKLLLDAGADPTIPNAQGLDAMQIARSRGHRGVEAVLQQHNRRAP